MKLIKKVLIYPLLFAIVSLNFLTITPALADLAGTYQGSLSVTTKSHSQDWREDAVTEWGWWSMFNKQVIALIWYAIDIFIAVWIAVALIWAYKIMVSDKEESSKEWLKMVIFWILWVVIMVSAKFLANSLVWNTGIITEIDADVGGDKKGLDGINFASQVYNNILYPFIKIALYLAVWVLFFITVAKVISYVTSTDDAAKKKAWWVIIWTVVWILIIMWAKQVVESIMWKQAAVTNSSATKLSEIWSHITNFESIPLVAQIVNRVMWLTMLAILILIIIQAYRMFAKPDDPKNRETLKKSILYILIWVLVIGAAYAISTVLVINKLPAS